MALLAPLLLPGCATTTRPEAARRTKQIVEECRAQRLTGQLSGHMASAWCANARVREVWLAAGYPYMDLIDLHLAYRMALAQRLDEGILTPEQATLEEAELVAWITGEIQRRDNLAALQRHEAEQLGQQRDRYSSSLTQWVGRRSAISCRLFRDRITCE